MIEIKISDPAGNRTRVAKLEGRDSTYQATETNTIIIKYRNKNEIVSCSKINDKQLWNVESWNSL